MGNSALPVVIMGRGSWQELADPAALQIFTSKFGEMAMLTWAISIASAFVILNLALSFYLLFDHLSGYSKPQEQKWLIGIILMVPTYTITSYASLCFSSISIYCQILGDTYEAFALYSFGQYLTACLGGEEMAAQKLAKQASEGAQEPLLDKEPIPREVVHPLPLRWLSHHWTLGRSFLNSAKFGIVQYIIIKVSCTWIAFILNLFDLYGEGEFDFTMGYPYITIIQNFSQMWALYCLVQFYHYTRHELEEIHPLAKFLCIKAVVFVTWWQGVVIALLFATGIAGKWIPGQPSAEQLDVLQSNLQDFVICIEMAFAAVAHIYVYPATPYRPDNKNNCNAIETVASQVEVDIEVAATSVKDSVKDVVMGGGENIVDDVKMTVTQAVQPVESGFTNANDKIQDNVSKIHENVSTWSGKSKELPGQVNVTRTETKEIVKTKVHRDDDSQS